MSNPYLVRLACQAFATFCVVNFGLGLLALLCAKCAIRYAQCRTVATSLAKPMTARAAANLMLGLRLLPSTLAALIVALICIPSYLWLEPAASEEQLMPACVALGIAGSLACLISIVGASRALLLSQKFYRDCRQEMRPSALQGEKIPAIVLRGERPVLALSGLLVPRLLISSVLLRELTTEELSIALLHERAHHASRDNAKRLLLLLAPGIFPFFQPFRRLEKNWAQFAEWAADDYATDGDPERAVLLASVLLHVARMGAGPSLPSLSTSLLGNQGETVARVERLLSTPPSPATASPSSRNSCLRVFIFSMVTGMALLAPSVLARVHTLLELLLH